MTFGVKRIAGIVLVQSALLITNTHSQTTQSASSNQAQATRPVLVELFTSEGCSSCPPADEFLRQIDGKRTDAGQLIIGISEHVTYWNQDGWTDPFSADAYTERQNAYAQRFHLNSVYTPQMVIDGNQQISGGNVPAVLHALIEDTKPQPVAVHINKIDRQGNALSVNFSITGSVPHSGAELFAVVVDDATKSSVGRGENSGRVLLHVSVAQLMKRVGKLNLSPDQTIQLRLPELDRESLNQGRHLILFAQTADIGPVLGADIKQF